jgi:hypothetical protein
MYVYINIYIDIWIYESGVLLFLIVNLLGGEELSIFIYVYI